MTQTTSHEAILQQTLPNNVTTEHIDEQAFAPVEAIEFEQTEAEALIVPMTQFDHMITYGRGVIGLAQDRLSDVHIGRPRVSTEQAAASVVAAVLAVGIATAADAKVKEPAAAGSTLPAEAAKKQTVPKPKKWVTTPLSDLDFRLQKKFMKESGQKGMECFPPKFCSPKKEFGSMSYRELSDGAEILSWRHTAKVRLYAVRQVLSGGKVRFIQNYKEQFKNGGFIKNKTTLSENGSIVSSEENVSGLTLYFKNKVRR